MTAGQAGRGTGKVEILAPAGSLAAMEAAAEAGCDAVYLGGASFGARAYADNLSEEQVLSAIDYMHLRGKSLYLTVNTLLKEQELRGRLYRYVERFYRQGLDAVLVQDVGVLRFLHQSFPELPLHISTQMTLTSAEALPLLADAGVTRIVVSRELGLPEIRAIRSQTELEIEAFVHGALCYCYSGQCLASSLSGGRSGNRGRCTQPCRLPYQLGGGEPGSLAAPQYWLSPKDICTLDRIPELVEAGIDSFKIEGRMKRPEYAALSSHLYRKWTDRYMELGREGYASYLERNRGEMEEDVRELSDLYNRGGFSDGYYGRRNGRGMMSLERPNHNGVLAATVEAVRGNQMLLRAEIDLNAQDVLEIRRDSAAEYEFTLKDGIRKGECFKSRFLPGSRIRPGQKGYRTKNATLLGRIGDEFLKHRRQLGVRGCFTAQPGEAIRLVVERPGQEGISVAVSGPCAEAAERQPVAEGRVREALGKTGESHYKWESLEVKMEGEVFFAMSAVNRLRREAFQALDEAWLSRFRREMGEGRNGEDAGRMAAAGSGEDTGRMAAAGSGEETERMAAAGNGEDTAEKTAAGMGNPEDAGRMFSAGAGSLEQVEEILKAGWIRRVYLSLDRLQADGLDRAAAQVREAGRELYYRFPAVSRAESFGILEEEGGFYRRLGAADGVLLCTMEEVGWFLGKREERPELAGLDMVLHASLYTWNRESAAFWREKGILHTTAPLELACGELGMLDLREAELVGYGFLPAMVSAQCVQKNAMGCICTHKGSAKGAGKETRKENGALYLQDRSGRKFPVVNCCRFCYNTIYHPEPLNLAGEAEEIRKLHVKGVRLEFIWEDAAEVRRVLAEWERVFSCNEAKTGGPAAANDSFEGHFRRGVE